MTAPSARRVDMLTGQVANEKFFAALSEADNLVRELDDLREMQTRVDELEADATVTREAFTAAAGWYDCPCGSGFQFHTDSTLEDYAALNIWLGRHVPCIDMVTVERDVLAERLAAAKAQLARMQATR